MKKQYLEIKEYRSEDWKKSLLMDFNRWVTLKISFRNQYIIMESLNGSFKIRSVWFWILKIVCFHLYFQWVLHCYFNELNKQGFSMISIWLLVDDSTNTTIIGNNVLIKRKEGWMIFFQSGIKILFDEFKSILHLCVP